MRIKVMHDCDHIITERKQKVVTKEITRGSGTTDKLDINNIKLILDIYRADDTLISPEIYKKSQSSIVWLFSEQQAAMTNPAYIKPTTGSKYKVVCVVTDYTTNIYDEETCPRCLGAGWYADIIGDNGVEAQDGTLLLVQDFMKCLLTSYYTSPADPSYGTSLNSLPGAMNANENVGVAINEAVITAEDRVKTNTNNDISRTDSEKLKSALLVKVEQSVEDSSFYITIELKTMEDDIITIGVPL